MFCHKTDHDVSIQALSNLRNWGAFFEVAGSWPIAGGTQKLVRAIYNDSGAELRLTTPVAAIDDQGEQVVITTQSGEKILTKSPCCCSIKCFI